MRMSQPGERLNVSKFDRGHAAAGLGDEGAEGVGEVAGVGEGVLFEEAVDESGSERVTRTNSVDNIDLATGELDEFAFVVGGDNSFGTERDDAGGEVPFDDGGGSEIGEGVGELEDAGEDFGFGFVEFENVGAREGIGNGLVGVTVFAQVQVENFEGLRRGVEEGV